MPDLIFQSGTGPLPTASNRLSNIGLTASAAGGALIITLTDAAGGTPAQTSIPPVQIGFRSATATSGLYSVRTASAAKSITIASATTIGMTSTVPAYVYVYAIDNAGTIELAVSLASYIDEGALLTTSAISGGSSATTVYSTAARTTVAVRMIGRVLVTETAGAWASPTEVSPFPFRQGRQIVIGTAQTSNGTVTSTSFAAFTNVPAVTIVATRTGNYRVSGNFSVSNGTVNTNNGLSIAASAGSPTVIFSQAAYWDIANTAANAGVANASFSPYIVCQLTAGSSYTFQLQGKSNTGTLTLLNASAATGHALIAEEL